MKKFLRSSLYFIIEAFFLVLCAYIASLAFPGPASDTGISWIAFFSLIPVFVVINRTSWIHAPFLGFIYGFMFFIFYNYWLSTFHPLAILIAPILKGVQYIHLFLCLKACCALFRKRSYLVQAFVYTAYLYLTQQGFIGYPYGNLSSAVTPYLVLLQIADITGIWGPAFLMTVSQTLAARMVTDRTFRLWFTDAMWITACWLMIIIYGLFAIWRYDSAVPDRTVRIAAVQHSADSWKGGDATYRKNFETLTSLTEEALQQEPDLVAWSETAFVPSVTWNMEYPVTPERGRLTREFVNFGLSLPVPLVTGNPESVIADETLPPVLDDGTYNWKKYNTVILFADGQVVDTYRKQHLVPFTEHFPYRDELPWLYEILLENDYNWWEEGDEATVFEYDGVSFSTPICFEDTFGYISAGFVRNGADFLLNMTNDVWSGVVPAEMQHMQLSVYRAVENRRPLLRSTNSGISCLISTTGEVIEPMEPFTQSWHIYSVPVVTDAPLTFYTLHPDLFAKLIVLAAVLSLSGALFMRIVFPERGKGLTDRAE